MRDFKNILKRNGIEFQLVLVLVLCQCRVLEYMGRHKLNSFIIISKPLSPNIISTEFLNEVKKKLIYFEIICHFKFLLNYIVFIID